MTAFTRTATIRFAHCDPAGLVFYPQFFALVNEAVEDWFAGPLGLSFKALHMERDKGVPTVRFEAEFMRPCRLGDELTQTLTVAALGGSSCVLRHAASVLGEQVAAFAQTIVYVDLASMRAEPWPPGLREAMSRYLEPRR